MFHACTFVDRHYLARALVLHASLKRQAEPFRLWIYCADEETEAVLRALRLDSVMPLSLSLLEKRYSDFAATKTSRAVYEYIATAKPFLLRYLLEGENPPPVLHYLDADLMFFGPPSALDAALDTGDVLLTPHHFPPHLATRSEKNGVFNAGYLAARASANGLAAIRWWCDRCVEWCYDRVEPGRNSNQKYLEEMSKLFKNVVACDHPGINTAPWNIDRWRFTFANGHILVDDKPLIFYHVHALKRLRSHLYDLGLSGYHMKGNAVLTAHVYRPYLKELAIIQRGLGDDALASSRKGKAAAAVTPGLLFSRLRKKQWLLA